MIEINNARQAVEAALTYFSHPEQEEIVIICLTSANLVKDIHFMALGSDTSCTVPLKAICKQALLDCACSVILMHSHPSGNPHPSKADIEQTEKLRTALNTLDMMLVDHIILSTISYYSLAEEKTSLISENKINLQK